MRAPLIAVLFAGLCAPLALCASAHAIAACGANGVFAVQGTTNTCTHTTVGEDTFAVSNGVSGVSVRAVGAPGGSGGNLLFRDGGSKLGGATWTSTTPPLHRALPVAATAAPAAGRGAPTEGAVLVAAAVVARPM